MNNPFNRADFRRRSFRPQPDLRLLYELETIRDRRHSDAEVTR